MKNFLLQREYMNIIAKSQKEFEKNLKNKKIMFIYEDKQKIIGMEEI